MLNLNGRNMQEIKGIMVLYLYIFNIFKLYTTLLSLVSFATAAHTSRYLLTTNMFDSRLIGSAHF